MKKNLLLSIGLLCSGMLFAQQSLLSGDSLPASHGFQFSKIHSNIQAGIGFGLGQSAGSYSFIAPSLSYDVTSRLSIHGGMMYTHGLIPFTMISESGFGSMNNGQRIMLFAGGSYKLNDRLTLNGDFYHDISSGTFNGCFGPRKYSYNTDHYSLGLDYKISEKAHIGFQISNGPSNNMLNPGMPFGQ